jgi:cytochrome c5
MSEQHDSPIKTPAQLITVVALSFIVPVAIIILLVTYVVGAKREGAGASSMTPEAVAERLRPVGNVVVASTGGGAGRGLQGGEAVYNLACGACHTPGIAGAPKTGDVAAWKPRLAQGFDTLVKHAVEGFKTMPAKGGNASLDPVEVARAVAFMGNKSGGKFTEPDAPAAAAAAPAAAPAPAAPPAAAPTAAAAPAAAPAAVAAAAPADAAAGEKVYNTFCAACHIAGVAGAPRTGDKAAWAPRLAQGVDALTQSVIKGKGVMPPKGGAVTASEADLRSSVEFMVGKVK